MVIITLKIKTITFAILCTFLLLMLPNVNAVEYKEVKEEKKLYLIQHINDIFKNLNKNTKGLIFNLLFLLYLIPVLSSFVYYSRALFFIVYSELGGLSNFWIMVNLILFLLMELFVVLPFCFLIPIIDFFSTKHIQYY